MAWLVIVVVIIAAVAVPRFGKALVKGVGALVVLVALAWGIFDSRQKAEREAAKSRIKPNEIELADLRLNNGYGPGSYALVGRVRNRSTRHSLGELHLRFTMKDCTDAGTCEIVGESDETIYINVPPGQARDLDEHVSFARLRSPRGKHQWSFDVKEIVGR